MRAAPALLTLLAAAATGCGGDDGPRCGDTPLPTPASWAQADAPQRAAIVKGLAPCDVLEGRNLREVRELLGPPTYSNDSAIVYQAPIDDRREQVIQLLLGGGLVIGVYVSEPAIPPDA
jgi:hypothetical protein